MNNRSGSFVKWVTTSLQASRRLLHAKTINEVVLRKESPHGCKRPDGCCTRKGRWRGRRVRVAAEGSRAHHARTAKWTFRNVKKKWTFRRKSEEEGIVEGSILEKWFEKRFFWERRLPLAICGKRKSENIYILVLRSIQVTSTCSMIANTLLCSYWYKIRA
jgi:hypothetical protein